MKSAMIAAAVLLASFTAVQAKPMRTLPSAVVGSWCLADQDKANNVTFYSRGKCTAEKGVDVFADNYSGNDYSCVVNGVEPLNSGATGKEAYLVHASCVNDESGSRRWKDNSMFQLIGGQLIVTPNFKKSDADWRRKQ
jgi:hypothetical protein